MAIAARDITNYTFLNRQYITFFNQEKIGRKKNMHSDDQRHKKTLKTRKNKQTKNVGKRVDKDEHKNIPQKMQSVKKLNKWQWQTNKPRENQTNKRIYKQTCWQNQKRSS